MGASVYYKQVKPVREREQVWAPAPSSLIRTLEEAFGAGPWELKEEDITLLSGMAIVYGDGETNPYRELIQAIQKLGVIYVWVEA